jgi:hypothetical protein
MKPMSQADLEARYVLFDKFAMADQRSYYKKTMEIFRASAQQVNRLRAGSAFLTGAAAAMAGLLVQIYFVDGASCGANALNPGDNCDTMRLAVSFLAGMAIVMPILGTIFGTLADLYQWDRLTTIYEAATENLEVADALSPRPRDKGVEYRAKLRAFAEGTLVVMEDETAQWGQAIRTPESLDRFIAEERARAAKVGGDADA